MKTKTVRTIIATASILALSLSGCSEKAAETETAGPIGAGQVTDVSGCKTFESNSSRSATTPTQSCIQYEYDGQSVLRITHIDAGFNCCPDSLGIRVHAVDGNITIQEIEWMVNGCHCLCLFDMTYEIPFVEPGQYTIKINEPYVLAEDEDLEFTVDLTAAPSGSVCADRSHYPWGES